MCVKQNAIKKNNLVTIATIVKGMDVRVAIRLKKPTY
jgi:hypothetical protein